jgi:hypothetical protein
MAKGTRTTTSAQTPLTQNLVLSARGRSRGGMEAV